MALIDSIININISRNTLGVSKEEFATIFVIGEPAADGVAAKFGEYQSLTAVAVDYAVDTKEYALAAGIFGQEVTVKRIYIAQRTFGETYLQTYTRYADITTFYAVVVTNELEEDLLPLAAAIEATQASGQSRILFAKEITPNTLALMTAIHAANYSRTAVIFNETQPATGLKTYAPAAWLGALLPIDPGTATFAYKTLKGIIADTATVGGLTPVKITDINTQKGNFYTKFAGRDVTFNGTMGSGEFIDIIYGIDWLENSMQQDLASIFLSNPKIPFTNQGIGLVETAMRTSLELGRSRGVIDSYNVVMPDITAIDPNDKANRDLKGITFTAIATGAIHKITINGYVTI